MQATGRLKTHVPDRLGQALGNLIENAIKYTPAGGMVSLEAGSTGSAIWIRISDTGQGIAEADQSHIFEPFYRSREATRVMIRSMRALALGLRCPAG